MQVGDWVQIFEYAQGYERDFHGDPVRVLEVGSEGGIRVNSNGCNFFISGEYKRVKGVEDECPPVTKSDILDQAKALITGNREGDYGDASKNFSDIAALWSVVLGVFVNPWQVAACMTQLKLARAIKTHDHHDSWVDMAGYVGLAGELALNGQ